MVRLFQQFLAAFLVFFLLTVSTRASQITPLVKPSWLKENLSASDLVVLDVRSPGSKGNPYLKGHIPGAHHAPYNTGWRERRDGIIGMLPSRDKIVSHIRSVGVNSSDHVIIVPHGTSSTDFGAATRVYWTFKVLGHQSVSILDGGYKAWARYGGSLSTKPTDFARGDFDGEINPTLIATQSEVQQSLRGGKAFVDARPVNQFEGRAKSPVVSKKGTIPGSKNLRQSTLYDAESGQFAGRSKLLELAAVAGLGGDDMPTVAFCNTGHWASLAWFALHEIKGDKNVTLYDGSMMEWTQNEGNPVEVKQE